MQKSPAVARQFLACGKLDEKGDEVTFQGIHKTGIPCLERMYSDRVAIKLTNRCPAYCVFCFRRWTNAKLPEPTLKDLDRAIAYIKKDKKLSGVLITGGDPLLEPKKLEYLIGRLRKILHVTDIRVGTRAPLTAPELVTPKLIALFKKNRIEVGVHFNHPDELTTRSKAALSKLTKAGIRVYNQSVLLKGINDSGPILEKLYRGLRDLGVEIYALYHCDPIKGALHLRTTIEKGLEIKRYLRSHATGRINPAYIVDTRIGKVEIGVDGTIEKREGKYVWIRTPYSSVPIKYLDGEK